MAALGDMANNHEATVTFEGDNHILVQRTSNWLIRQWNDVQSGLVSSSPLATVDFFVKGPVMLQKKFDLNKQSRLTFECMLFTNFFLNVNF